ncbi:MAG: hypothetical protein LBV19_08240 [Streptococcaceae bacterium]|jgi:hypothetical protein|nr:hypothetical protein [Streptococcaceae bacterium]
MTVLGIIFLAISLISLVVLIRLPLYAEGGSGTMMERGIYLLGWPVILTLLNVFSTIFGLGFLAIGSVTLGFVTEQNDWRLFVAGVTVIIILGSYAGTLLHVNHNKALKLIESNYKSERWNLFQVTQIIHDAAGSALMRLGVAWSLLTSFGVAMFIITYETGGEALQPQTTEEWLLYFQIIAVMILSIAVPLNIRNMQRTNLWKSLLKKEIISAIPEGQLSNKKWKKDHFVGFDTIKDSDGEPILDDKGLPNLVSPLPPLYKDVEAEKAETIDLPLQNVESKDSQKVLSSLHNEEVNQKVDSSPTQFDNYSIDEQSNEEASLPEKEVPEKNTESTDSTFHDTDAESRVRKKKGIKFKW